MGATLTQIYASTVLYAVIGSGPYYQLDWSHSKTSSSREMTQRREVEKATDYNICSDAHPAKKKTAVVQFGNKQNQSCSTSAPGSMAVWSSPRGALAPP